MDLSTSVASRFVSEKQLTEAQEKRQAEWKEAYARMGQEPPPTNPIEGEPYDGRSLYEKLQEHKNKKQEAFDEALKFKNQFRALDEDEINFLDSMTDENNEEELARQQEIQDELRNFKQAVSSRSQAPPPPLIASISGLALPSTSATSPILTSTSPTTTTKKPLPPPPKKKKNLLSGVVVKKKTSPLSTTCPTTSKAEPSSSGVGSKRRESDAISEAKDKHDEGEATKKRRLSASKAEESSEKE
ncbi:BQ5605_C008g05142 [Microbotryum silenes-dioicae]|uniref:BQ5605_C008g05142 protein n=1 Tax=Microbotryum silenes-dioicae TaxID=796604 RepID=A0A2X0MFN8_9BASI|nr:BQ5605_C008g05142 [Microbotryum silenes-dioicae]